MSILEHAAQASDRARWQTIAAMLPTVLTATFIAVMLSFPDPDLAAWWPPGGFAAAAVMLARRRERAVVVLLVVGATVVGDLLAGHDVFFALMLGIGSGFESLIIAAFLAPRGHPCALTSFTAASRVVTSITLAAATSGIVIGLVVAIALDRSIVVVIGQLTAAHAAASIVTLAVLMAPLPRRRDMRGAEVVVQTAAVCGVTVLVFWPGNDWPLAFLPLAGLLWGALRLPPIVVGIQLVGISAAVIVLTNLGGGPFAGEEGDPRVSVVLIQLFLVFYTATTMLVGGARSDWSSLVNRLEAQREALRQGINAAEAGIVFLDRSARNARVIAINERARAVLGQERPPWGVAELDDAVSGAAPSAPARISFERGGKEYEAVISEELAGAEKGLLSIVISDVTERESRTRQAEQVADEFRRLNLQQESFIAAVTHELRTPVTSILGFAELLTESEPPATIAPMIAVIERNARRLADLIDNVLELSEVSPAGAVESGLEQVDLAMLVEESVAHVAGLGHARDVRVEVGGAQRGSLVVMTRRRDVERVLTNLLSNAVKFSFDGGLVSVELESEGDVPATLSADGPVITIRVVDHGPGIPPEYRELVWERFGRVPSDEYRAVPGTGLGLPIVRSIVENRLGGSVTLVDTAGGGTTAIVRLPVSASNAVTNGSGDIDDRTRNANG